MKTIAVTGANGTIGQRLVEHLRGAYDVRAITRRRIEGMESTVVDLGDLGAVTSALRGADAVVHLAAASGVESEWGDVLESNIVGAYNVYEGAVEAGVAQVIFASTNHVVGMYAVERAPAELYRGGAGLMIDRHDPVRPDSLYGASKAFGEALGRYYGERRGLRVQCLRIGWMTDWDGPVPPDDIESLPWPPHEGELDRHEIARRAAAYWLSHRDFATLVEACLRADGVRFGIYHAVSDNPYRFWSLDAAKAELGWQPQDGASVPGGEVVASNGWPRGTSLRT